MSEKNVVFIEKHTLSSRWLHWINVPLLGLMIWSGILIYWAHQPYIKIPIEVAEEYSIQYRLAEGMGWHFFIMWPYALNGLCYLIYLGISGQWRSIVPKRSDFRDAILIVLHDLKLRDKRPTSEGKYNAAQKIAYSGAILMGIGTIITGLAVYKPVQLELLTSLLGGYEAARLEHFILMMGLLFFFCIHMIQVLRSGWNGFRGMIAGYEIEK